jgi:hypothetical protein
VERDKPKKKTESVGQTLPQLPWKKKERRRIIIITIIAIAKQ